MPYAFEFLTLAIITLLAAMSPGPDFAVVSKNALRHSQRAGLFTALGIGLGILVHVAYSLVGIGLLIAQSLVLFTIIKLIGAAYLIYLGWHCLMHASDGAAEMQQVHERMPATRAIKEGFITNALNPKVTLFFLSVFSQMIDPATPVGIQLLMGLEMSVVSIVWFGFLTLLLNRPSIKRGFGHFHRIINRMMGAFLIGLGIKLMASKANAV